MMKRALCAALSLALWTPLAAAAPLESAPPMELTSPAVILAEAATGLGVDLSEVLQRNLDKLHARYPQGFDTKRSQQREAE